VAALLDVDSWLTTLSSNELGFALSTVSCVVMISSVNLQSHMVSSESTEQSAI
jgi:uncharacterized membrane protein YqhA